MTNNTSKHKEYDIVIIGAGMSGCLLAHAILKRSPSLKVALLDDNPEKLSKGAHPGFDARSIALSAGSCALLDDLGLWSELKHKGQPIDDINISDRGHFGILDLQKNSNGAPFGYVVELQEMGEIINKRLARYTQLARVYNARLQSIGKNIDQLTCRLEDGQVFRAKLCVGADGANSLTRDLLAIDAQTDDYGCSAIIANVVTSQAHLNKAYERFTQFGPIALLPLTKHRYSLVWSVANQQVEHLTALSETAFLAELQQAFGYRAGIFKQAGKRDVYPLQLLQTVKPVTHRGLCIGNAAHALHPVMGQGFNLGLRDLYVLAKVVSQHTDNEQLGSYLMLNRYWSARQADHHKTIQMTDLMVRIFSRSDWPFVIGRNIGLQAMSCLPSLASPIVKQASGYLNEINYDPIL